MKSGITFGTVAVAILLSVAPVQGAEPIQGRWLLVSQEVGGQKTPIDELTLRINPVSNPMSKALEFAYSVPVNNIQFVSLRFAARPDGTEADVNDANGKKIGTVKITKSGASQYKVVLQGQNRPTATGAMTVSADGKTMTSESESKPPGQTAPVHTVQVFSRQQ
jgi:hypothetical protein